MSERLAEEAQGRHEFLQRVCQDFRIVIGKYATSQDVLPDLDHLAPRLKEVAAPEIAEATLRERVEQAYHLYVDVLKEDEGDNHQAYPEVMPEVIWQLMLDIEEDLTREQIEQIQLGLVTFIENPELKKRRDEIIEAMSEEDLPVDEKGETNE